MAMPEKYKRYMSEDAWNGLALHQLRPSFRDSVMSVLETGLRNSGGDEQDVDVVLGLVQDYANDLRDASKLNWEGLDEAEIASAEQMADYVSDLNEKGEILDEVDRRDQEADKKREEQGERE
jgi:hypothetical protein